MRSGVLFAALLFGLGIESRAEMGYQADPSSCDAALHMALSEVPQVDAAGSKKALETSKRRSIRELQKKHPSLTGIQINHSYIPEHVRKEVTSDYFDNALHALPLFGNSRSLEMGHLDYKIDARGIMTMKVSVRPDYKGQGVFSVLTAAVLNKHRHIKGNLDMLRDDNARAFFRGLAAQSKNPGKNGAKKKYLEMIEQKHEFTIRDFFVDTFGSLKEAKNAIATRNAILKAFRKSTPSGKVMKKFGLKQVRAIYIDVDTKDIRVMSLKGDALPDDQISVSFGRSSKNGSQLWVLHPDGRVELRQKDHEFEWLK